MLLIISPAKRLNMSAIPDKPEFTLPEYVGKAEKLVSSLKKLKPADLAHLMDINPQLAQLNYDRYQLWNANFSSANSRQAVLAFDGDVYDGMKARDWTEQEVGYAQSHLRILSGLYGFLRPLDLIQAYRLEMGTAFSYKNHENLYGFWSKDITRSLNRDLKAEGSKILINLASVEYFKVIEKKSIKARIIAPAFREFHEGSYKMFSIFGKRARGMMTSWIIKNQIQNPDDLIAFNEEGYQYNAQLSGKDMPVFTRG